MAGDVCDVCGGKSVGVASSGTIPVSYAYCARCLTSGYMSWNEIVTLAFTCGFEGVDEDVLALVDESLEFHGRGREDAELEAERIESSYIRQMETETLLMEFLNYICTKEDPNLDDHREIVMDFLEQRREGNTEEAAVEEDEF